LREGKVVVFENQDCIGLIYSGKEGYNFALMEWGAVRNVNGKKLV
jgi:hypothetical protein